VLAVDPEVSLGSEGVLSIELGLGEPEGLQRSCLRLPRRVSGRVSVGSSETWEKVGLGINAASGSKSHCQAEYSSDGCWRRPGALEDKLALPGMSPASYAPFPQIDGGATTCATSHKT
jgi:hypothetical protein